MRHTTKGSWTTARLEELGSVTVRCLDLDERMADLAKGMREEVGRMAAATAGARAAREEVRYLGQQRKPTKATLDLVVHDIEADVRKAARFDVGCDTYRAMFPDGLNGLMGVAQGLRTRRLKALVQTLAQATGQEAAAKALADAMAAFEAAKGIYQASRSKSQAATKAVELARASFLANYRLAQATVFARVKDAKVAAALFPDMRTVARSSGGDVTPANPAAIPALPTNPAVQPSLVPPDHINAA
jgi:hypothetical protein